LYQMLAHLPVQEDQPPGEKARLGVHDNRSPLRGDAVRVIGVDKGKGQGES
jgi:hypothetical protein